MQIARILTCVACSFPLLLTSQSTSGDVAEAQSAFTSGQYSRAAELYKKAVATHSPSAELQTDLGLAYQMQGEHLKPWELSCSLAGRGITPNQRVADN